MKNISLFILFISLFSCGKIFQKDDDKTKEERTRPQINDNVDIYLRSQETKCEKEENCNPSIGKLVVWNQNLITECTGALIAKNLFITSSHCLPRNMRVTGMGCQGKASISFPSLGQFVAENAYCSQVSFSDTQDLNQDPATIRTSFTILKLDRQVDRPVMKIARTGLDNLRSYHVWASTYDSSTQSTIVKKKCRPVYQSYANPFAKKETSPGVVMSGCHLERGNIGGIIVNNRQNIVGILNSSLQPKLINLLKDSNLYNGDLGHLTYGSNAFCLKYDSPTSGDVFDEECTKSFSIYNLDRERSKILQSRLNHLDVMNNYEQKFEKSDRYFRWDIIFSIDKIAGVFEMEMTRPKCFFKVKEWISEFKKGRRILNAGYIEHEIPKVKIFTVLDENLIAKSQVMEEGIKRYRFSFSPVSAYYDKKSYVRVHELGILTPTSTRFDDVTDECH